MRVIAGSARGVPLAGPPGAARPTMDRVRAAMFSSLGDAVPGARVLDLFAGSGALGIEAVSRGAASAVFVDSDTRACATIRKNLAKTRIVGTGIQCMDAFRFLELYAGENRFDLVFADPPYAKDEGARDFAADLLRCAPLAAALAESGTFILEHGGDRFPGCGDFFEVLKQKTYGGTSVAFLTRRIER